LKEWLTIGDAARHLSTVFEESVSEADILQYASLMKFADIFSLPSRANWRVGSLVPISDATFKQFPALTLKSDEVPGEPVRIYRGPIVSTEGVQTHVLELEDGIRELKGVYDLPMIGGEIQDVENRYQLLTGGPVATGVFMDGAFIEASDGRICQLQKDYEDNEFCAGTNANLHRLMDEIRAKKYDAPKADSLLAQHKEHRREFLARPRDERYFPMGHLPNDAVLVVRTDAIAAFIDAINAEAADGDDISAAPFFDAESGDYPMLLHVAVRAWEHARKQAGGGTPKQRIAAYIADRYPEIPEGTRDSMASIANWQRLGGRPKTGE
jgi:hypothetical protein